MKAYFSISRLGLLLFSVVVLLAVGCNSDSSEPGKAAESKSGKKSDRNLSITKANAYSDLFIDSMDLEKFISQQKLNDKLAEDFRLFYNLRNFQMAWFSSAGVTEQTLSFRSLYDYDKDSGVARKSLDNRLDDILTNDSLGAITANANIKKNRAFVKLAVSQLYLPEIFPCWH